jgi:hypothetical protein
MPQDKAAMNSAHQSAVAGKTLIYDVAYSLSVAQPQTTNMQHHIN